MDDDARKPAKREEDEHEEEDDEIGEFGRLVSTRVRGILYAVGKQFDYGSFRRFSPVTGGSE